MAELPIGLQLYTVRDHMEKDLEGTLASVRKAGYTYVEVAGTYGLSGADFRKRLDDNGLKALGAHIGLGAFQSDFEGNAGLMEALGAHYTAPSFFLSKEESTKAAWLKFASDMDAAGAKLRARGLQMCYHNHAHEFETFDGQTIFDLIYSNSTPENVQIEQDTAWTSIAGHDPVALIEKYGSRMPLLHIKDYKPGADGQGQTFVEVGCGVMDWDPILAAGKKAGVKFYIVEQDSCEGDSLAAATVSYENLAAKLS